MRVGDTIVSRSSPGGRSVRGLVRLSGPRAHECVVLMCVGEGCGVEGGVGGARIGAIGRTDTPSVRLAEPRLTPPPHAGEVIGGAVRAARSAPSVPSAAWGGVVRLAVDVGGGARAELPALATFFHGPRSATGEDVAEVLLAGNPALIERVIGAALGAFPGEVRRAEAGEFTARAFLNGRIDLSQAEGIARVISARSEAQRAAGERLAGGETGRRVRGWTDGLADLLALVEAGIDFTDQEDVVPIAPAALGRAVAGLREEIVEVLSASPAGERREGRARVVLVGPANAGKSTLFNALLGRRRAVVSATPGSTRDVLVEVLDLSGDLAGAGEVELCDLAGLAEGGGGLLGAGMADAAGQRAAREAIVGADVLVLCAAGGRFDAIEAMLPAGASGAGRLRVRTKADVPGGSREGAAVAVCALDGWGVGALRRGIADLVAEVAGGARGGVEGDVLPRHRAAMEEAAGALARAAHDIDAGSASLRSPELVAASLREALDALGQITGRTTPEEILGRVFATFCVGK